MRHLLICLIGAIILSSCSNGEAAKTTAPKVERPKETSAMFRYDMWSHSIDTVRVTLDEMEYLIIHAMDGGVEAGVLNTINLTKDKLEVELLRKQINE